MASPHDLFKIVRSAARVMNGMVFDALIHFHGRPLIPLDDTQIIRPPWRPKLPGVLINRDTRAGPLAAIGQLAQHPRFHQGIVIGLQLGDLVL